MSKVDPALRPGGMRDLSPVTRFAVHVFCLSLLGLLFKQLRSFNGSLGIFELTSLICATYFLVLPRGPASLADRDFIRFTFVRVAAFMAGATASYLFFPDHFSLREVAATLFIAFLLFGWIEMRSVGLAERLTLLRDYIGYYCLVTVLAAVLLFPTTAKLWYFGEYMWRLMGLSDNPNQLAALAIAGLLLTVLLRQSVRNFGRRDMVLCVAMLAAGVLSGSMAFRLSILVLVAVMALFAIRDAIRKNPSVKRLVLIGVAVLMLGIAIVLKLYGARLLQELLDLYEGGTGKGSVRVSYWLTAFSELLRSPLVGLGPGGHVRVDHTPELQEAHNVIVELLLSGGIVALGAFLWLVWRSGAAAWRNQLFVVVACLVALVAFGAFHTVLRHITYWIVLHACVTLSYGALPPPAKPA